MTTIEIQVPAELAQRLRPYQHDLARLLEWGLRYLEDQASSPPDEQSEEYLALAEQLEALDEAAGCWSDEHHPDLTTDQDIDNWLADLRRNWSKELG